MLKVIDLREQDDQDLLKRSVAILPHMIQHQQDLIDNMIKIAEETGALGLAAPQLGENKRIIIHKNTKGSYDVLINPKIIAWGGRVMSRAEGCLSLPGERYDVKRKKDIVVVGMDREGTPVRIKVRNKRMAFVIQHEVDHLNAILIRHVGTKVDY